MGSKSDSVVSLLFVCLLLSPVESSDENPNVLAVLPSSHDFDSNRDINIVDTSKCKLAHRRLVQATSTWNFRPLAPKDDRLDPFDKFNHYRRGYDIKSKHYWGSVAFAGIYGYAIAVAWVALGLFLLLFICCRVCFCAGTKSGSKWPHSRQYHWLPPVVVVFLSAIAVGCCVVLFVACKRFTAQVYNVEDVIVEAAQNATDSIHSVTDTLGDVKDVVLPYNRELYHSINSTQAKLNSLALVVTDKVFVNKKLYQRIFKIIEIAFLVVTSANLLLIVLGFASTFLRWRRFFVLVFVLTWIFITLSWIMFGFFLTVHFLADDTCLAFKEYLQEPKNTTLDDLLPCADLASSSSQYLEVRKNMKAILTWATNQLLYYTNGSTSLIGVCDPIGPPPSYKYSGICANDTLPIGELANLVEPFVCNGTRKACLRIYPFYINQTTYNTISAIARASQSTLNAFPAMEGLTNCSLVTNPISTMVNVRCGPARIAINRIWITFTVLSSIMILLLPFWCLAKHCNSNITSIAPQPSHLIPKPSTSMLVPRENQSRQLRV